MLNLPQNIKKKVVVLVEEQELELYLSKDFTNNELKNIFSLIIPGYPSNFTLSQIDNSSVKFSDKFCKIHHLSGNRFLPIDEKTIENLLQSICFENEIFKKVKKNERKGSNTAQNKMRKFF
jgi:meiotically up-regulated gene 157 (Mug157) protein